MLTIYLASRGLEHILHFKHMLLCSFRTGILPEWKLKRWKISFFSSLLSSFYNPDRRLSGIFRQNVIVGNPRLYTRRRNTARCSADKLSRWIFLFDCSPFIVWSNSCSTEDKVREIWIRAMCLTTITLLARV